jgi:hypothetical protein
VPAFASLDDTGERALLDERFEHYLARHVGDEGMLARLLGGVVESVVERPAQPAAWTFAAVDGAGELHHLAPAAAQVTADGELVLDAVPVTHPLTAPKLDADEVPASLVLPGLKLDDDELVELAAHFDAFGPAALPVQSVRGDRLIGLATALWAAEVRDTLRAAATSVSTVVSHCVGEIVLQRVSLRHEADGRASVVPHRHSKRRAPLAVVEPSQKWNDNDERLALGGAVAREKLLTEVAGNIFDEQQFRALATAFAGFSKIAASETGKTLLYYLTDRAQRSYWAETLPVQRRLRTGDLLARISIPGGFAGLAELIGDHRRGADYEEFFSALEVSRYVDKGIGQLLSYRLTGPTGEGEPGAKVTKSVLHIRLHEPLLPFHVAYLGGHRRAPLVPVTLDVPLPVKKPLSRQLHRAASDLADAVLRTLALRYEETLDEGGEGKGGVELTEQEFAELAALGHTSRKLSRDSLRRCVEALVEGGVTGKNKPAEPLLFVTAPNCYRAAREIMHRDFTKAATGRANGRKGAARKLQAPAMLGE